MKIVFMGTPEFSVPILEALHKKYEIVLVISQPNKLKKKGQWIDTPVAATAKRLGLPLYQPEKVGADVEYIQSFQADVLVTAAFGQYIPSKVLALFKKTMNVHGSLLPKYRGGAPIQRSIMNGDTKTGITIIEMAKKLDAGIMYAKRECPILESDTSSTMFEKLSYIGRDLLLEVIEDIYTGKLTGEVQNEEEVTYAPNLTPEEEILDFNRPAKDIVHQIMGLSLDPGATILFKDVKLKVFQAKVVADASLNQPGTVLSLKKQVLIKALDDAVSLDLILIPGKKMLPARDFVNGQKILKEFDVI
ncbi:MAG: methionyl-tRNA formyltransferase [Anaeroplasmataceae bacterium]|nr:methionyl-tRNA formyltransferase [Anaeroplasmataceae bacterium]MDE6414421.1 methionyl-tRNA formyltransferase [Anaeroplasmataceae bacterium]